MGYTDATDPSGWSDERLEEHAAKWAGLLHGTCKVCRCSIVNYGHGWYHTSERPIVPYPGHYAEPKEEAVA